MKSSGHFKVLRFEFPRFFSNLPLGSLESAWKPACVAVVETNSGRQHADNHHEFIAGGRPGQILHQALVRATDL